MHHLCKDFLHYQPIRIQGMSDFQDDEDTSQPFLWCANFWLIASVKHPYTLGTYKLNSCKN